MTQEQVAAAIEVLARYGINVTAPWDGDQDDREAEVFRALCEALKAADDKGDDEATTVYGRLLWRHADEARKDMNSDRRRKLFDLIEAFRAEFTAECEVWEARYDAERRPPAPGDAP